MKKQWMYERSNSVFNSTIGYDANYSYNTLSCDDGDFKPMRAQQALSIVVKRLDTSQRAQNHEKALLKQPRAHTFIDFYQTTCV
jgi:hypothetical protein